MNKARKLLADAATFLDIPADIMAGLPHMELTGFREFSIEPHCGLLEYEREQISIETRLGKVCILGQELTIKLMNCHRITIRGRLTAVQLQEGGHE